MGSLLALGASLALEDCLILATHLSKHTSYQKAIEIYEANQIARATSFLEAEMELTNILLLVNEMQYNNFINDIKYPKSETSSFMNLLKYPDNSYDMRGGCHSIAYLNNA